MSEYKANSRKLLRACMYIYQIAVFCLCSAQNYDILCFFKTGIGNIQTTGASARTASQDGLPAGLYYMTSGIHLVLSISFK